MKKCIIVDIDGTLADISHRRHHVEGDKKDWALFKQGMHKDTVNEWCKWIVLMALQDGLKVFFVTGRMADCSTITREWVYENFGLEAQHMSFFFRNVGDYRKDSIVKEEIYKKYIEPCYDVLFVVDDRKQVVDMWREQGLTCLQCAEGDF